MSSGMLGLENSNPGRKLQFVIFDLQFFDFEKGLGPKCPKLSPQNRGFCWGLTLFLTVPNGTFGLPVPNSPAVPWSLKTYDWIRNHYIFVMKSIIKVFGVVLRHLPVSKNCQGFCLVWPLLKLTKLTKLDSNWLKLTTIDYNCLKLTAIWLKLPKAWGKIEWLPNPFLIYYSKWPPGRRDEPLDTREWKGTKNPQPLPGRKENVNVTGILLWNLISLHLHPRYIFLLFGI